MQPTSNDLLLFLLCLLLLLFAHMIRWQDAEAHRLEADTQALIAKEDKLQARLEALTVIVETEPLPIVCDLPESTFTPDPEIPLSGELQEHTYNECARLPMDQDEAFRIALALMWRESGYQTDAVGYNANGTYDSGLMQINTITQAFCEERGIDWRTEEGNITAGIALLEYYMTDHDLSIEEALSAYAGGLNGRHSDWAQGKAAEIMEIVKGDYYGKL